MGEAIFNTLLSKETLLAHLSDARWRIVDCRFSLADTGAGRMAYQVGHIPGAIYAHLDEDLSSPVIPGKTGRHPLPERDVLVEKLSTWGIDQDVQVVAYDDKTGMVAARLWWLLRSLGHTRVAVLDGGFSGWMTLPDAPLTTEVPDIAPRTFITRPAVGHEVNAEQVEQLRQDADFVLVDSREAYRYRGESEPIDPIAGHIPGAVNAFFMDNLDAEGYFLPKEQLRSQFELLMTGKPASQTVFYCGSGVSACHNILALAHAGLGDATLYPGSWSEWITDPKRPVEKGEGL
jgi:thiosulfate/3-mercaptopyruvate sulfurtransferase